MAAADLLRSGTDLWHPVAGECDLPYRHVFQAKLLGQELAIWRADDDNVNVWENRCLHRGVRLSIATNDGRELQCQYHGWRYANRTAACTYIPAHPANAPARTITNRTFPVRVAGGMVWTSIGEPLDDSPVAPDGLGLRPVPVGAPVEDVLEMLLESPPALRTGAETVARADHPFRVLIDGFGTLFVQPIDADRSIIRGVVDSTLAPTAPRERLTLLRHVDRQLARLRAPAEQRSASATAREPLVPTYQPVPDDLAGLPEDDYRELPTRVRVARAWEAGAEIRALELVAVGDSPLPSGQPGAHIDVGLSGGLVRQYSLINGPGETDRYVIGVKRTRDSSGGSIAVHEHLREGDVLAVSLPRNCFPLRRDRGRTVLVAGGIGITPLLAMAQTLDHQQLDFELHYFVGTQADVAFRDRLDRLPGVRVVVGLSPAETEAELGRILREGAGEHTQAYLCGPPPMLETGRQLAAGAGWPREDVHVEFFRNDHEIDDSSQFELVLARSVLNLTVEPGATMLETLRAAGVFVPSSCEQGACGTCMVPVIDGEPDHQDVFLADEEKSAGDCVMTCVSRSLSPQLTLDL